MMTSLSTANKNKSEKQKKERCTGRQEQNDAQPVATLLVTRSNLVTLEVASGSPLDTFHPKLTKELEDKLFFSDLGEGLNKSPAPSPEHCEASLKFKPETNLLKVFSSLNLEKKELCGGVGHDWITIHQGKKSSSSSYEYEVPWHFHPDGLDSFSWTDWVTFISFGCRVSILLTLKKAVVYQNQVVEKSLRDKGPNLKVAILSKRLEASHGIENPNDCSDEFLLQYFKTHRKEFALG
jgi:hypothetical protein